MAPTLMARKTWMAVAVVTIAAGCASTSTSRSPAIGDPFAGSSSDVITTSELKRLTPGLTALDAVEHARPWFLHPRGSVAAVSVDGSPATDASVLRAIPVSDVQEVRLVRDASAVAVIRPDGAVVIGTVILVVTRKKPE